MSDEAIQDDVAAICRALGLGDHARSSSAHVVIHEEIIPAIQRLRTPERKVNPEDLVSRIPSSSSREKREG